MPNNVKYVMLSTVAALIVAACGESEPPAPPSASNEPASVVAAPEMPPVITEEVQPTMDTVAESAETVIEVPESVPEIAEPESAPLSTSTPVETVAPAESAAEAPVAATTTESSATAAPVDGGHVYNTYCAICHRAGMNAAPKFGSKPLWAKRIAQGRETVYSHAVNGLRGMPPRGGFSNLSDEEVVAAVDYMVRASGGWGK